MKHSSTQLGISQVSKGPTRPLAEQPATVSSTMQLDNADASRHKPPSKSRDQRGDQNSNHTHKTPRKVSHPNQAGNPIKTAASSLAA